MNRSINIQSELIRIKGAFPERLRSEVESVLNSVSIQSQHQAHWSYVMNLEGNEIEMPSRIYWEEQKLMQSNELNQVQTEILACILTRHHNGFVREKYLNQIISSSNYWTVPFIVQIIGEYVVELLELVMKEFNSIDSQNIIDFIDENELYWFTTKQRVASYWDCYHRFRGNPKKEYVGYQLIERFEELTEKKTIPNTRS